MTESRHETPAIEAMMERMFRGLVRRAGAGDTEALEALAHLERVAGLAHTVALDQAHTVRGGLYSWTELANVTGTSRQAVRQRVERLTTDPPTWAGARRLVDFLRR